MIQSAATTPAAATIIIITCVATKVKVNATVAAVTVAPTGADRTAGSIMCCRPHTHTHTHTHVRKKDNWLALSLLCFLFTTLSCSVAALSYPSAQQEHDMLILDALSRRSGTGYYGENSVMEMLSRSTGSAPHSLSFPLPRFPLSHCACN